jgi:hypothetical protein
MLWLVIIAGVLAGVGEILVIVAAGAFERELGWPDYLASLGPFAAVIMLLVFYFFLPWPIALALSFVVVGLTIWGVTFLLKVPMKRQVR